MSIRAKKYLGQHFLRDTEIAARIVGSLSEVPKEAVILEVGPGMGILTDYLIRKYPNQTRVVDIDRDSIDYLRRKYGNHTDSIIEEDFLGMDLKSVSENKLIIIGNFPYNISSQIFFKVLNYQDQIIEVVGMVQKEVGERLASSAGRKSYGILSVFLGVYYDIEYLFTVEPDVFTPKPKVRSAVIRLRRNNIRKLPCDEKIFYKIVKEGFQKRRKTLRNALKALNLPGSLTELDLFDQRAEQLTVGEFIELTIKIESIWKRSSHSN